uniref:HDAC_interact domain-containing protein n=1 Tax=Steinernema glaseri TaxID=37863 RepID=A0A1I7Z1M1_9BILA
MILISPFQEGLTVYLEWLITSKFPLAESDVDERCREAKAAALPQEGRSALLEAFREMEQARAACSEKAPVVFHMLDSAFGPRLVPRFLHRLFEKFAWRSTSFSDWVETLNEVAKTSLPGDLLTSYFARPGYPLVFVDFRPRESLRLSQRQVIGDEPLSSNASSPFVVPLELDDSSAERKTRFVVLKELTQAEEAPSASWVVADPLSLTYSRVVYSVENYAGIVECAASEECHFPEKVLERVVGDFCWALLKDVFEATESETPAWRRLLRSLAAAKVAAGDCACCVDVASRHSRHCKWTWVDRCQKVSLLKQVSAEEGPRRSVRARH